MRVLGVHLLEERDDASDIRSKINLKLLPFEHGDGQFLVVNVIVALHGNGKKIREKKREERRRKKKK